MTQPAPAGGAEYTNSLITPEHFDYVSTGNASTGTAKATFRNNTGETLEISKVYLAVNTAPTGAALVVDVKVAGTSAFTTAGRPKIAAGAKSGSAKPDAPNVVAPGASITVDVTAIGSTVAGADLSVIVKAVRVAQGKIGWKQLRDGYVRPNIREAELLPVDVNPA